VCIADTYFDLYTVMNGPVKTILQFGFLSVSLMIIAELRFKMNKAAPRLAIFIHSITMYFGLTAGISTLLPVALGIEITLSHVLYAAMLLLVGIYAAIRLFAYDPLPQLPSTVTTVQGAEHVGEEVDS